MQLPKGGRASLGKVGEISEPITFLLSWQPEGPHCEMDVSAFVIGANGKIADERDFVFYNNPESNGGAVKLAEAQSVSEGMRQELSIVPSLIPDGAQEIVVALSVYNARSRKLTLRHLLKLEARILDASGNELALFVPELDQHADHTVIEIGKVYLRNGEWRFHALGQGEPGGLRGCLGRYHTEVPEEEEAEAEIRETAQLPSLDTILDPPAPEPAASDELTLKQRVGIYVGIVHRIAAFVAKAGFQREGSDFHADIWSQTFRLATQMLSRFRPFTHDEVEFLRQVFYKPEVETEVVVNEMRDLLIDGRDFKLFYVIPDYLHAVIAHDRAAGTFLTRNVLRALELMSLEILGEEAAPDARKTSGLASYLGYFREHAEHAGVNAGPLISEGLTPETVRERIGAWSIAELLELPVIVKWTGSGFLISERGLVVTNHHVIEDTEHLEVCFVNRGMKWRGKVLVSDKDNDLALVELPDFNYAEVSDQPLPFTLGAPDSGKLGQEVYTLGFPLGSIMGEKVRLSMGRVSSLFGIHENPRDLQISNPIQQGNSGGPLFNMRGEVVGIVSSGLNAALLYDKMGVLPQNMNFAVKVNFLHKLLEGTDYAEEITARVGELKGVDLEDQLERVQPFMTQIKAYDE